MRVEMDNYCPSHAEMMASAFRSIASLEIPPLKQESLSCTFCSTAFKSSGWEPLVGFEINLEGHDQHFYKQWNQKRKKTSVTEDASSRKANVAREAHLPAGARACAPPGVSPQPWAAPGAPAQGRLWTLAFKSWARLDRSWRTSYPTDSEPCFLLRRRACASFFRSTSFSAVQVRKLTSLFQTKIKGVFLSFLQILQQASRISIPTWVLVFCFVF